MPPSFVLVTEPFIPCLLLTGQQVEYGLRDVLVHAQQIAEIRDDSPLVTVALHRLLLAILHRCHGGPKNAAERVAIWKSQRFDPDLINSYFAKWVDRFDLFHEKFPFYQRPGFATKEPSGINRLAQELARGNNAALFDHSTDDPPPAFSPAQAARAVIAEQAYAVGGGKSDTGNTTHAPLVSGATVLAQGNSLFETLWLNLTIFFNKEPVPSLPNDVPVWEKTPAEPHKQPSHPHGYLDYLTWQSRTLRLHPEEDGGQVVVRRVSYAQGRKLEPPVGFHDPMMAYFRRDKKDEFQPVRFNESRDLWRDSAALFQASKAHQLHDKAPKCLHTLTSFELRDILQESRNRRLTVFGLCMDSRKAAKVNFWRHETMPLPLAFLIKPELVESLKEALQLAETVARTLRTATFWAVVQIKKDLSQIGRDDATRALEFTAGNDRSPKRRPDPIGSCVKSLAPDRDYWAHLEPRFRRFLEKLAAALDAEDRNSQLGIWFHQHLAQLADAAFAGVAKALSKSQRDFHGVAVGQQYLSRRLRTLGKKYPTSDRSHMESSHA